MSTSSFRSLLFSHLAVLLLFIGSFFPDTVHAQNFRVDSTGPYTIVSPDGTANYQDLRVTNVANGRVSMFVEVIGSSTFTIQPAYYFNFVADSTPYTVRVVYEGPPGDTSHASILISDGVDTSLVEVTGIDQRAHEPAWTIQRAILDLGSGFVMPDSAYVWILNERLDSIEISSTVLSSSGITMMPEQNQKIAPRSTAMYLFRFQPGIDTAYMHVEFSGEGHRDTLHIRGRRVADPLNWQTLINFDPMYDGVTLCDYIILTNTLETVMTIDSVAVIEPASQFSLSNLSTLPVQLNPGEQLAFQPCFTGTSDPFTDYYGHVRILYHLDIDDRERDHTVTLHGRSQPCISLSNNFIYFDTVPIGTTWKKSFWLYNDRDSSVTIDSLQSLSAPTTAITLTPSMPITLAAHDSVEIEVEYTADTSQPNSLHATYASECGYAEINILGYPFDDPTSHGLQASDTLDFIADNSGDTIVYRFHNATIDSIKVLSVSLAQHQYFSITSIAPTQPEFKLGPADVMTVTVRFEGPPGTYNDTLIIVTESGIVALNFPIHGLIGSSAVAATKVSSQPKLVITPNPSRANVRMSIENATPTSMEVLDVLGARVISFNMREASWNASTAPRGTYFVRATGIDIHGKHFVITRRLILE